MTVSIKDIRYKKIYSLDSDKNYNFFTKKNANFVNIVYNHKYSKPVNEVK